MLHHSKIASTLKHDIRLRGYLLEILVQNVGKPLELVLAGEAYNNTRWYGHHLFAERLYLIFVHDHRVRFWDSSLLSRRTAVITKIQDVEHADDGAKLFGIKTS